VLTQGNLASNLEQVLEVIGFLKPGGTLLSILPPWHMFERMVEYALLALGLRVVYTDRRHFAKDLQHFRPDVLAAVPRMWMLLMEGVLAKLASAPPGKRRLVERSLALARARELPRRFRGAPRSLAAEILGPVDALLRRVVLQKIAVAMGVDRIVHGLGISGGGSLPDHVDLFFRALGIHLLNGYGLTETSPVLTLRLPWRNAGGTVGPPLSGTEISVRDPETGAELPIGRRGVVHARGPQVMHGYFQDPEATAAAFCAGGWFNTGDLGMRTADGDLALTGRAKDTIVLLSGENVEPEPIENALTSSPLIEQAIVVGQDRKFLAALIVPRDRDDGAAAAAAGASAGSTAGREQQLAALRREIDDRVSTARGFRSNERIVRFRLLEKPLTFEDGFLSQTLKVKRGVVHERLAADIDALYRGADDAG
jgi:long-chain acyl-CoA synthetase